MALYPGSEKETRIPVDVLDAAVLEIFQACGMNEVAARAVTRSLVDADTRGIHSHGVLRVPDYVKKLTEEGVDPRGEPRIVTDAVAALVVDGANNLGAVAMTFAMEKTIERAHDVNVAFAAVAGSNHAGTMELYARMAVQAGMIGLAGTNALPTMAPWGGRDKIVGINPLAVAIPGGEMGDFVLDIAFGQTAHGKIRVFAQKGEPIPPDWAFDAAGNPTTDAVAALDGLIRPIGGHKGVGLGMAVGMLSGLLSGGAYGLETGNMVDGPKPGVDSHFVMAINVAAFQDLDAVRARVDGILREMRTSRPAEGNDRLYTPGEIEADLEVKFRREGIPLNDATLADILSMAGKVGADVSELSRITGPIA
jgi:LDH2 family malate/lactate/ureidoglycolate dehydrogenase